MADVDPGPGGGHPREQRVDVAVVALEAAQLFVEVAGRYAPALDQLDVQRNEPRRLMYGDALLVVRNAADRQRRGDALGAARERADILAFAERARGREVIGLRREPQRRLGRPPLQA